MISTEITRLQSAKAALKTAINSKNDSSHQIDDETLEDYAGFVDNISTGGSATLITKTITENGTYDASDDSADGYSEVTVNVQPLQEAESKDVNFYDYDGKILYSYTANEFAQLTEMPANPTHAGLISQGWNWTLADAKTQVTSVGACDIGQMYVTDDGKTRLYCHIEDALKSFYFGIAPNGTVVIDWGDESNTDTVTGTSNTTLVNTQHTYSKGGDYIITISVTSGNFSFYSTTSGYHLFCYTTSNVTTAARPFLAFLRKVELGTNARLGQCSFTYCTNLETITIPKTIDSISTRIFEGCFSLRHVTFPKRDGTLFSSIQSYFAKYCYSLKSFSIPTGITKFNTQSLYATFSLYRLILPTTVTTISNSALTTDYALSKLVLPSGVTSIETKAFSGCYGMREYHFKSTTPPTLDNADAFTDIRSACVIYVPSASLNNYKTASNWSTYASQMVGE